MKRSKQTICRTLKRVLFHLNRLVIFLCKYLASYINYFSFLKFKLVEEVTFQGAFIRFASLDTKCSFCDSSGILFFSLLSSHLIFTISTSFILSSTMFFSNTSLLVSIDFLFDFIVLDIAISSESLH